ncbi:MAG: glycosyltransferase [Bacteroidetes bacterium]|nr:glycosyltransferase [Bacteroidota bacterium]
MKIFVLLSRVPYPLDKGDKLRAFHQVKELSKRHEIILCALSEGPVSDEARNVLSQYCKHLEIIPLKKYLIPFNILKSFLKGNPLQVGFFYQNEVQKKINQLINEHQPEHIFCQLVRVLEYVKHLNIPITLDYMDALSKGVERRISSANIFYKPVFHLESTRLKAYEQKAFENVTGRSIISIQDRDLINHPDKEQILVVPNGVDTEYFQPQALQADYSLVFTGNMNYPPNVECAEYLAKEIFPELLKKIPGAKLLISGVNPSSSVKALESENITVSGWVKDIRQSYARASIFIAPMRIGTGLQNKLLEAMAMKKPCITSELANNALGAVAGKDILVGQSTAEYVDLIVKLLNDDKLRLELAQNGYSFVHNTYNWAKSTALLEQLMIIGV